eukprot:347253-Rhodomonas_salina.2
MSASAPIRTPKSNSRVLTEAVDLPPYSLSRSRRQAFAGSRDSYASFSSERCQHGGPGGAANREPEIRTRTER